MILSTQSLVDRDTGFDIIDHPGLCDISRRNVSFVCLKHGAWPRPCILVHDY
jgi:hypothetical protein